MLLQLGECQVFFCIKETLKGFWFAFPYETLSRLYQLVQFVRCWQIFPELNSKRLHQSSGREKESRCLV